MRRLRRLTWLDHLIHALIFHVQLINPARPKKPCGRTIRTTAISAKIETLAISGANSDVMLTTTPTSRPARTAPPIDPMPPTTGDDKGFGQDRAAHLGNDTLQRRCQQAGKAGNRGADSENNQPDSRNVDAQHTHDLRIARAGPDDQTEAGLFEKQPKRQQHDRGGADHEQPIQREIADADVDGALQNLWRVERISGLAEGDTDQFDHHIAQSKRQQQRIIDTASVERPDQDAFDGEPEQANRQRHRDQADPEVSAERQHVKPGIGSDHVKGAVGEIDHGQHAEDQGKTDREQHIDRAERQTGEQLQCNQIKAQAGHALSPTAARARWGTRRPRYQAL